MEKKELKDNPFTIEDATDKMVRSAFLFDFYGELLNEHQRNVYQAYVCDNLSFTEIAEENNVSRQSVHDLIKRCDAILEQYEQKLHLVEKFQTMKREITRINELASKKTGSLLTEICDISSRLLLEL